VSRKLSWIVVGNIVRAPVRGDVGTVHRCARALRQRHRGRHGHVFGTVIHHGRVRRCTFAQAQRSIAITVVGATIRRSLMRRARGAHLGRPDADAARRRAVGLPAEAPAAHEEQARASTASLDDKQQIVHRLQATTTTNLPWPPVPRIVGSKPASIG